MYTQPKKKTMIRINYIIYTFNSTHLANIRLEKISLGNEYSTLPSQVVMSNKWFHWSGTTQLSNFGPGG